MQYPKNKRRNRLEVDTESLRIICNTYNTRNGYAHEVSVYGAGSEVWEAKKNYQGRTWESFEYESVIRKVAQKLPKQYESELLKYCDDREEKERIECEKWSKNFAKLHNGLTDSQKQTLSNVTLHNESEARAVMGIMACMNLMNKGAE